MSFMLRDGWRCQFLEEDLKTPLPKRLNFRTHERRRSERSRNEADATSTLKLASRSILESKLVAVEFG
jgi:hypothetical protein